MKPGCVLLGVMRKTRLPFMFVLIQQLNKRNKTKVKGQRFFIPSSTCMCINIHYLISDRQNLDVCIRKIRCVCVELNSVVFKEMVCHRSLFSPG